MHTDQDRVLALAGVCQAARLTQQIARRGMADSEAVRTSVESLFKIDAADVVDVYGDIRGLATGLQTLSAQLSGAGGRDLELTRHLVTLLRLERRLARRPTMLEAIGRGIASAGARLAHFPPLHPNILAQLAGIYRETVSTLGPRVMVHGEPLHLQNPENVDRIRTLLLSGIRSARLWRQVGGRRWQILLNRGRIVSVARELLRGMGS